MLKKALFMLVLCLGVVAIVDASQRTKSSKNKASRNNCFCTCFCGHKTAASDEKPYYSEKGVKVMNDSGKIETIHNFCDIKYYNRAKGGMCSPDGK